MADLQELLTAIDELEPDDLEQVYHHITQRRKASYWLIPGENLKAIRDIMQPVYDQSAHLTDEEIDAAIDDALRSAKKRLNMPLDLR